MNDEQDPSQPPIPPPAQRSRRGRLPIQRPKPSKDDPEAIARVRAILESPTYRQADEDLELLQRDETRGLRLQMDYMKAELLLRRFGVQRTVVVYGSTRILEPEAAARRVCSLEARLRHAPHDESLQRQLEIALRLQAKSRYYDEARAFGRLVSLAGDGPDDTRVMIMTGGGPGMMEAANRGAFDVGAKSIGLNITLPYEQFPNPYITPELCFRFHYFAMRKLHFVMRACALVVFPGGFGTLDELFDTLTLIQTRKMQIVPVVLVGEHYWRRLIDIDYLVEEGVIDTEDRELFWYAETAQEAWDGIERWYAIKGESLFEPVPEHAGTK